MAQFSPIETRSRARVACLALWLAATLSACAFGVDQKPKSLVKDCVLPQDQLGTLTGHWSQIYKGQAIPLAFHQGDWQPDELADMVKAADSWNTFYNQTQGISKVLDYGGDPSNPRTSNATTAGSLCATGITQGNTFVGNVVIYKRGKWPYASQVTSTIALTSFCPTPAKPLNNFYMAIMEVNYQGFFVQGRKVPDLQTIILHELGHLLGLGHSCEGAPQKSGVPNCNDSSLDPGYHEAVLFPVFSFDENFNGEQKRDLATNDQGRANCLYFPGAAPSSSGH